MVSNQCWMVRPPGCQAMTEPRILDGFSWTTNGTVFETARLTHSGGFVPPSQMLLAALNRESAARNEIFPENGQTDQLKVELTPFFDIIHDVLSVQNKLLPIRIIQSGRLFFCAVTNKELASTTPAENCSIKL